MQDILEKCDYELGAIQLIDSHIGVSGQMAWIPSAIAG
jgi:hypothetical protein